MKRTNVVLDEDLLESARRLGGERTYQATITKALEEYVKKRDFWEKYRRFADEAKKGGFFHAEYLKEKASRAVLDVEAPKKRVSADQKRAPRAKKAKPRGTR